MRLLPPTLAAAVTALVLSLGSASAWAQHPRSSPEAAANKQRKDARRYGAGSEVTRSRETYNPNLGPNLRGVNKSVRVRRPDGSRTGRDTKRSVDGSGETRNTFRNGKYTEFRSWNRQAAIKDDGFLADAPAQVENRLLRYNSAEEITRNTSETRELDSTR
jgi:hypothetical protein